MRFLKAVLVIFAFGAIMTSCSEENESPVLTISAPTDMTSVKQGDVIGFSVEATDDVAVTSIQMQGTSIGVDEVFSTFTDPTDARVNVNLTIDPTTPTGNYVITFIANDADGNEDRETITIIIVE